MRYLNDHAAPASPGREQRTDVDFAELYRRWYRPVVRLCRRRLGFGHDVEAIAQEAFLRAWLSWDRYADDRPFGPWVSTIASRICSTEAATAKRRDHVVARSALEQTSSSVDDSFQQVVRGHGLYQALRSLPPRARRLVLLRDLEGLSYEQIAAREQVSVDAVRGGLKRARAAFRDAYRDAAGSPAAVGGTASLLHRAGEALLRRTQGMLRIGAGRGQGWEPLAATVMLLLGPATPGGITVAAAGPPVVAGAAYSAPSEAPVPTVATGEAQHHGAPTAGGVSTSSPLGSEATAAAADFPREGYRYSFTSSPSYDSDRTVFASGFAGGPPIAGCPPGGCARLLKSQDGGTTWEVLPARGLSPGRVLLPPDYPRDNRIFGAPAAGLVDGVLSVSHDGGATFTALGSPRGAVVMSPKFGLGDPRILMGAKSTNPVPWVYRDDRKRLEPLVLPTPTGYVPVDFAFSPDAGDEDVLLVSAFAPAPAPGPLTVWSAAVFRCDRSGCDRSLIEPYTSGTFTFTDAPGGPLAWHASRIYRSLDNGRSFELLPRPGAGAGEELQEVVSDARGRLVARTSTQSASSALYSSEDAGATWSALPSPPQPVVESLHGLPDGALLVSGLPSAGPAIHCSIDGGRTWTRSCAAR